MANILIEQDTMTNIANAIRAKNGLSTTYTPAQMINAINDLSTSESGGSGGGSSLDAVRFIDYDGTVLYSYSASEFANLTEMPANPTHMGLTSQGWNWTLADAKAQVTAMSSCDIGQMYITDDGKTRIYISLVDSARLSPYLGICPNGTVVVDWGDNTATDTLTGTSLTTVQRARHTYASTGEYIITLTVSSGTFAICGSISSSNGSYLLTRTNENSNSQRGYQNAIKKVELGANASVGGNAFSYCYSLTSITIPSSVTTIDTYAFRYCYSLLGITIPNGVTSIGSNMFSNCYSLKSIAISSSVTSIGSSALSACYSLPNIAIPSSVTSIGTYAFSSCTSLTNITMPSSVITISAYAFYNCYSLQNITIPSGVTSINDNTFGYCYSLSSITIPSGVTNIGNSAFYGCYSLPSITIPNGVTSIGGGAFNSCASLISITIPSGVTSIGDSTFVYCNTLTNITIPSGVTSIGTQAFYNCYSVVEYHFLSTTPPTLANTNAFTGILTDCKIYVPSASLTAYQGATNWSTYASYMIGE